MTGEKESGYVPVEKLRRKQFVFVYEGYATEATKEIAKKLESLENLNAFVTSTNVSHGEGSRIAISVVIEHD